jgi:hypothetical protein
MFKRLEARWNAATPVWLHPYTKENMFAQLIATAVLLGVFIAKDEWELRQEKRKRLTEPDPQN